jgi:hypothetical protein
MRAEVSEAHRTAAGGLDDQALEFLLSLGRAPATPKTEAA